MGPPSEVRPAHTYSTQRQPGWLVQLSGSSKLVQGAQVPEQPPVVDQVHPR